MCERTFLQKKRKNIIRKATEYFAKMHSPWHKQNRLLLREAIELKKKRKKKKKSPEIVEDVHACAVQPH